MLLLLITCTFLQGGFCSCLSFLVDDFIVASSLLSRLTLNTNLCFNTKHKYLHYFQHLHYVGYQDNRSIVIEDQWVSRSLDLSGLASSRSSLFLKPVIFFVPDHTSVISFCWTWFFLYASLLALILRETWTCASIIPCFPPWRLFFFSWLAIQLHSQPCHWCPAHVVGSMHPHL